MPEPSPAWRSLAVVLLALPPAAAAFQPELQADTWWHLAVGRWVVEHGTVPTVDPLSQAGREWVAYSWLFEVALYGAYHLGGLAGVVVLRAALVACVVWAWFGFVLRREARFWPAAGVLGLTVAAVAPSVLTERPWLFSMLFTLATLEAVERVRAGEPVRRFVWLPAVFAAWANLHVQFVFGLFVLGLGCLSARRVVPLAAACTLALFANPYHYRLAVVVGEYATQGNAYRLMNELKPFTATGLPQCAALALVTAAVYQLGRRGGDRFDAPLLAGAAVFMSRAVRDLWFGALAAAVVLTRPDRTGGQPAGRQVAAAFALTAVLTHFSLGLLAPRVAESAAHTFPVAAVAHVRAMGWADPASERLFNDNVWGGYLAWALPELPVCVDGRTNLHNDTLARNHDTWGGFPGWDRDPDLAAATLVVGPSGAPLAQLLRLDERWELSYDDDRAVVLRRAGRR